MNENHKKLSKNRSKHHLKCHIIFSCKYRKSLFLDKINDDMKEICQKIADKSDFEIEAMESDKNHIHFLINYIPRISITSIVRRLKQESTIAIWQLHKVLLKQNFWKENTFYSDGYFVCSIGNASPETVKQYILNQG